ncbi:MAG TPA: MFS transporter [Verrucomicrobiae bacterium]|nr:MFS transporter [Verrucomicrobiae bacterium]
MERWKKNLYVVGFAQVLGFGTITFIMSFLPLYIKTLGVTDPKAVALWSGILMGTAALFASISGPIWGNVGDRKGRKIMVERVLFSNAIVSGLMGFSTSVWQLLVLRAVQGMLGGFMATSIALVTSIAPATEVGFALGFYQTAMTVGNAMGPLLGGFLTDTFSYTSAFLVMAALAFIAALLVRYLVYENFIPPKSKTSQQGFFSSLKQLLSDRSLLAMLLVNFLVQYSLMVISPIVPLFVHSLAPEVGYITTLTGLIIASGGLASAVSAIYSGRLSDRMGHKQVLIFMTLGAALSVGLQTAVTSPWQFLALRIVSGAFMGGMLPAANALIYSLIPGDQKGTAFGVSTSFSLLGNVLGPISGGFLAASPLGYRGVFVVTALLLLFTVLWIRKSLVTRVDMT